MVGPPKTLQDLRKVEGAVRVTCRQCGHVALLDREQLIAERLGFRQSCDWQTVRHDMTCRSPRCDSRDVAVEGVAFGEGMPELRRRRAVMITIELALQILLVAAYPSGHSPMPVEAIRLALRVLHPYLGDRAMLDTFWRSYSAEVQRPWDTPSTYYRPIVQRLIERGYAVPAELRMGA